MPTHDETERFRADWQGLTRAEQLRFRTAVGKFVSGLREHPQRFDPGLRVKRVQGQLRVWEMTWAPDGRATFTYGEARTPGEPHIVWRRIGGHDIFGQP